MHTIPLPTDNTVLESRIVGTPDQLEHTIILVFWDRQVVTTIRAPYTREEVEWAVAALLIRDGIADKLFDKILAREMETLFPE